MARRIFYFSGYRMKVFEWHGRELLGSFSFEPDEEGFAQLDEYLANATEIPSQLLVDLIEEDFRRESIPHVIGRDRKAVITRMMDRHYRGEPHVHVEYLGRSKEGRRDESILLSALTNSSILTPWLELMQKHELPLAGIWSMPILSAQLLPALRPPEKNTLILSRHIRTAQRESYFQDGKLLLSRQTNLDRDRREDDTPTTSVSKLVAGTEQIHIFLTNQRIMGFTDPLNVYCILPEELIEPAREIAKDTNTIKYTLMNLNVLFAYYKLQHCQTKAVDVLFSYLCAKMPLNRDHYAQHKDKKYFYRYVFDRFVAISTSLGAFIALFTVGLLLLNSVELGQKQQVIETQRIIFARQFQNDFSHMEKKLVDSENVQATVELANRLQKDAKNSPEEFFIPLSSVFSDPRFEHLQLDALTWKKYTSVELAQLLQVEQANVSEKLPVDLNAYEEPVPEASTENNFQSLIKLNGYLHRGDLSYRETVALMNEFADAIHALPCVAQVVVLKVPVDVRPGMGFTDTASAGGDQTAGPSEEKIANNRYELLVALKAEVPPHE